MTNEARVDKVLAWLDLPPAERPSFITCYFSDTDDAGHDDGPESRSGPRGGRCVSTGCSDVSSTASRSRGLGDRVNIVITSDHGMAATSQDRVIVIDDYLDASTVDIVDINPTIGIVPKTVTADEVYARLEKAHPHLRVYRREQTPEHWRYRDNPRIPAIVGVADDGWVVLRQRAGQPRPVVRSGGAHGYDPRALSMHGLFVAAGPAFRRGVTVPPFENVHIYNALAAALAVTPAQNDGDVLIANKLVIDRLAYARAASSSR